MLGLVPEPEQGQCPRCCLAALVDAARRRPCPTSTLVDRRETRVSAIPPIRPELRRRRRHADGRRRRARATPAWLDRRPLAGWTAHPGSAGPRRSRSVPPTRPALSIRFAWEAAAASANAPLLLLGERSSARMRGRRPIGRRKTRASRRRGMQSLARSGSEVAGEQAGVSPSGWLAASDHEVRVLADEAGPRHADGDLHARA
jgi:hypothetical protein